MKPDHTCPDVRGMAFEYRRDELGEPARALVDEHLRGCAACATWVDNIEAWLVAAAADRPVAKEDADALWQRIEAALPEAGPTEMAAHPVGLAGASEGDVAERPATARSRSAKRLGWLLAAAAMVAAALLVGVLWNPAPAIPPGPAPSPAPLAAEPVPAGPEAVALGDAPGRAEVARAAAVTRAAEVAHAAAAAQAAEVAHTAEVAHPTEAEPQPPLAQGPAVEASAPGPQARAVRTQVAEIPRSAERETERQGTEGERRHARRRPDGHAPTPTPVALASATAVEEAQGAAAVDSAQAPPQAAPVEPEASRSQARAAAAEDALALAERAQSEGRYSDAVAILEDVVGTGSAGPWATGLARLDLARLYERRLARPRQALYHLTQFLAEHPADPTAASAQREMCLLAARLDVEERACPRTAN